MHSPAISDLHWNRQRLKCGHCEARELADGRVQGHETAANGGAKLAASSDIGTTMHPLCVTQTEGL